VDSGIYTAYSGMQAQSDALDALANNLANINTTGFKEEKTFFSMLKQESDASNPDINSATDQPIIAQGSLNPTEGSLERTDRELDVAINGNGFLAVQMPQGVRYTRNGNLSLDVNGTLIASGKFPVLGASGKSITLGAGTIQIGQDGDISLNGASVDKLKLVSFDNMSNIEREGNSLFKYKGSESSIKTSDAAIKSGYLEQSNVNPVASMVQMIDIQRRFDAMQKSVNLLLNDINAKVIDKLGH
jgi:flagellar basal-body rod protein FlgF